MAAMKALKEKAKVEDSVTNAFSKAEEDATKKVTMTETAKGKAEDKLQSRKE